jgi:hypothetical protein
LAKYLIHVTDKITLISTLNLCGLRLFAERNHILQHHFKPATMGRELQKKKNRSSIAKVRQKPKSKKVNPLGNPIIAANWYLPPSPPPSHSSTPNLQLQLQLQLV